MRVTEKQKRDFTNGKVLKNLILFSLPMAFATILQMLFNSADVAIVGQFGGSVYQAAVGATTSTVHLLVNLFAGIAIGANVAQAQAFGAKNEEKQHRVVHTAMATSILSGIIVLALGLGLSRVILVAIDTPKEILEYSVLYMQIYFLGAPAMMIYNFGSAIMRSVGETKKPLLYLLVSGILNLIINIVTVLFLHMHVAGVALGTTVSQCVSAVWVVIDLRKAKNASRYEIRKTRFYKKELKKILGIGIPMGLNGCLFSVSNLLIQSSINAYGELAIAGNTVAVNIEAYGDAFAMAIENGTVTFVGQNIGAKKPERVHRILGACLFSCLLFQTVYGVFLAVAGQYFCMAFNADPLVIEWAMRRIMVVGISYVATTPMRGYSAALKGMGHSLYPMFVNLVFTCLVRVLYLIFLYPRFAVQTIEQIYILYPATWIISGLILLATYYYTARRDKKR